MRQFFFVILLIPFVVLFQGCRNTGYDIDVSDIELDLTVNRLDQDLFAADSMPADSLNAFLLKKYPVFYEEYLSKIVRVGNPESPMIAYTLNEFVSDPSINEIQQAINDAYPDFTSQKQNLEEAFKRYKYFFPGKVVPEIVTFNGGYNYGIYPMDSVLGIGLEWYLGADNEIVSRLAPEMFPQYKRDNMASRYLEVNAMKGWLLVNNQDIDDRIHLLGQMAFQGKIMYILHVLMPWEQERDLFGYNAEEWEWCEGHEYEIWSHFIDQELLFSNDASQIAKLMQDGPFTPGMPPESPGGVGKWIGYQMIKAFMEDNNENVNFQELLLLKDNQRILKSYKPGR